ncbi:hypothetical protein CVT26_010733 [Gymnopilus dilepis]|uniref:Uncharacterized protein n=1 Tax=Gymnopilus dilepis TaxID=231916 RepID=A0A409Y0V3_9AGAR|nr:hypothetical protein CVT26_010733 [Gymnopilus dilepis]
MSSSSSAHSRWEEGQPRRFSVPLPTTRRRTDHTDPFPALKLKCSHTLCVVAVGDAIHLYLLPDFVFQRTIRHPSGAAVHDFDVHDTLLAVFFYDGTLGIWDVPEGRCRSITRVMSVADQVELGSFLFSNIRIIVPAPGQVKVSGNSPSTEENGVVHGEEEEPKFVTWIYDTIRSDIVKCQVWKQPNLQLEEQDPQASIKDNKTVVGYEVGHGDDRIVGFMLWNNQSGKTFGDYTLTVDRWHTVHGLYPGPRFCIALVERRHDAYYLEVLDFGVNDDNHSDNSGRPSRQDEEEDSTPLEQNTRWHRMSIAGCGILYYVLVASLLYFSS